MSYNEDVLFAIDACSVSGQVKLIPNILYVYRIRQHGSLMSTYSEKRFLDMARAANKLAAKYLERKDLTQDTIRRTIASFYRNCFVWSEHPTWEKLKRLVDWPSFRKASSVNFKSYAIFWGFRLALSPTVSFLAKRNR